MEIIKKLKSDRKLLLIVIGVIIAVFLIPYIAIPTIGIWWFYKKSKFSKRFKIIATSSIGGIVGVLVIWFGIAYTTDAEPHLSVTEPSSLMTTVKAPQITIKGTFTPQDRKVTINGQQISTAHGTFTTTYDLKEGENKIDVEAGNIKQADVYLDITRQLTDAEKALRITPTTTPTVTPIAKPTIHVVLTNTPTPTPKPKAKSATAPQISQQVKNDYISFYKQYMDIANQSDATNNKILDDLNAVSSGTSSMTTADLYLEASDAHDTQNNLKLEAVSLHIPDSLSKYHDDLQNADDSLFGLISARTDVMQSMAEYLNGDDLSKIKDIRNSTQDQQSAMINAVVSIVKVGTELGVDTTKIQAAQ